jgi:hypothetical protein
VTFYAIRVKARLGHQKDNKGPWPIGGWIHRWKCSGADCNGPCPGEAWQVSGMDVPEKLWTNQGQAEKVAESVWRQFGVKCEVITLVRSTELRTD